jgi:hypothetical protein
MLAQLLEPLIVHLQKADKARNESLMENPSSYLFIDFLQKLARKSYTGDTAYAPKQWTKLWQHTEIICLYLRKLES